ncbi:MAG: DUF6883 domain-containing protein [Candidatus Acidiferrales bacterium]
MKLPNPERAIVDQAKLTGYCLNPRHPRGRHKARVFAATLNIILKNSELLRKALLQAAVNNEAIPTQRDVYGSATW